MIFRPHRITRPGRNGAIETLLVGLFGFQKQLIWITRPGRNGAIETSAH